MQATIDAFDGRGPLDYSDAIDVKHPIRIVRQLNEPSVCSFGLVRTSNTSPQLLRNSRVAVSSESGACYFSGYVAMEPVMEYLGDGTEGPSYTALVSAISDEVLLDRQALSRTSVTAGLPVSSLMTSLTSSIGAGLINSDGVACPQLLGQFAPNETETWSRNAGELASRARASYRVMNGNLSLTPVGTTVHPLSESNGTLHVNALKASMTKELVNDVTLCGEEEPAAYVTELFQGDGTTAVFGLTAKPFATRTSTNTWVIDDFTGPAINTRIWNLVFPASHLKLTSAGLTFCGGSGIEGQTYITTNAALELGGSLLLEAGGVVLGAGSDGLLLSLCVGAGTETSCFAGFRVKQSGGSIYFVPIVGGAEAGSSFAVTVGNMYTLRLRIYCREQQRVLESFYSVGDTGLKRFGGTSIPADASVMMEVQELINGFPAPAVILYDGLISEAPATCNLVLASNTNLTGSLRSVRVERPGQALVSTAGLNEAWRTRRIGANATTGDCKLEASGSIRFFAGAIPSAGECIRVCYRTRRLAIARLSHQDSVAGEGVAGFSGTSARAGTLTRPKARSSVDCENGAQALLNTSCSRSAALEGRYGMVVADGQEFPGGDVWPGDVLALDSSTGNLRAAVVVRDVKLEVTPTAPQLLRYTIDFANDWARELSVSISSSVAANAWIPPSPNTQVLGSLSGLALRVSGGTIAVDAGVSPPAGGGFEVRRRDWAFAPGADSDLVLRSPVQNFAIPRWAATEQYFVRMYDASNPPVYSRVSSAIFLNLTM